MQTLMHLKFPDSINCQEKRKRKSARPTRERRHEKAAKTPHDNAFFLPNQG